MERLTPDFGLRKLAQTTGKESVSLFRHGTLEIKLYNPNTIDRQQPHTRDEIYVVISGSGTFVIDSQRQQFQQGEVLFAPAGVVHRFEDFTEDFSTWVFFYGPEGGEETVSHRVA